MRVFFSVPSEAPSQLYEAISEDGVLDAAKLKLLLFRYFVSEDLPQTYILPRSILREVIDKSISHMSAYEKEFPEFGLLNDARKFVKCSYDDIWGVLVKEWKARLISACGHKPGEVELPRGFDPWLDLNDS